MMSVCGRIQREDDVVHLVVQKVTDLSAELASVGSRKGVFPIPHSRGDQAGNGAGPNRRDLPPKRFPGLEFFDSTATSTRSK